MDKKECWRKGDEGSDEEVLREEVVQVRVGKSSWYDNYAVS